MRETIWAFVIFLSGWPPRARALGGQGFGWGLGVETRNQRPAGGDRTPLGRRRPINVDAGQEIIRDSG